MKNLCYESTKECNLQCDYCISSDNIQSCKSEEEYIQIIDLIAMFQPERLVISGGEPLLDQELVDKLKLIREKCPDTFISISTNGSIEYDFMKIRDYIDCLDFSLPAINKDIYKTMREKDCVDDVLKNIKLAKRKNINLRLSYTLTKVNSCELQDILDFAERAGIEEVRIGRFFPFRKAQLCKEKYELTDSEINEIIGKIENKYTFRIVPPISNLEYMENGYLTVNYLGELFLPTRNGKMVIGNVRNITQEDVEAIEKEQCKIFKATNMHKRTFIQKILTPQRLRPTTSEYTRSAVEEFYSDRSRIIYSQAFRRLQQKAQVFSLETNSSVRSRLSHSIEVSDVGRLMARKIADKLAQLPEEDPYFLNREDAEKIIAIVENACLLHDIGNPPFGHFGETAIQRWWEKNYESYISQYNIRAKRREETQINFKDDNSRYEVYLSDFAQFDGNPQGLRTILRLRKDEVIQEKKAEEDKKDAKEEKNITESGMNLTYQTILSCIKYVIGAGENNPAVNDALKKKAGYFQTEKKLLQTIYSDMGVSMNKRFPFVYIMEAADDISYCMSDVADSIEKGITSLEQFVFDFEKIWKENFGEDQIDRVMSKDLRKDILEGKKNDFNLWLASPWAAAMTEAAADQFVRNRKDYFEGVAEAIVDDGDREEFKISKVIGLYARKNIYTASEAEQIEVAGYAIISGLLECFGQLLTLTKEEFLQLLDSKINIKKEKLEVESRLCHLLGEKYVTSYRNQLQEWGGNTVDERIEWWLRAHLIVDHIAGMTDEYALKMYQLCKGISVITF